MFLLSMRDLKDVFMRHRKISSLSTVMLLATGLLAGGEASAAGPAACTYQSQQLPGLPGGSSHGQLLDTDGDRHFIGYGYAGTISDPYPHATIWRDGAVLAEFGPLNSISSVNRSGDLVGGGLNSIQGTVLVPHGARPIQLAIPAQMTRANPNAASISEDGLIVGDGLFDDGSVHALSWSLTTAGTVVRDHGVLGTVSWPPAGRRWPGLEEVDDTGGQVVGSIKSGSHFRAVTGTVGNLVPLSGVDANLDSTATNIAGRFTLGTGTVPGQGTGAVLWENGAARLLPLSGAATDVNSSGVVTGYEGDRALVLNGGDRTVLPPLPGHTRARANALTEDGRVIGWSNTATGDSVNSLPVVWTCG